MDLGGSGRPKGIVLLSCCCDRCRAVFLPPGTAPVAKKRIKIRALEVGPMVGWPSGRMNPDPGDKMKESERGPLLLAAASSLHFRPGLSFAVARSRNRAVASFLLPFPLSLSSSPPVCVLPPPPPLRLRRYSGRISFSATSPRQSPDHGQSRGPISPASSSGTFFFYPRSSATGKRKNTRRRERRTEGEIKRFRSNPFGDQSKTAFYRPALSASPRGGEEFYEG